ncbi:hypothetical protein [Methanoregula sp.]|uniref:hypothetical protein n=1 Tax=Methanoregula sp. TaxID=2052170 RepID=UPI00356859EA
MYVLETCAKSETFPDTDPFSADSDLERHPVNNVRMRQSRMKKNRIVVFFPDIG